MKKYVMGVFAVVLAFAATAFTVKPSQSVNDEFFWYDAVTLELMDETPSELPPNGCQLSGGTTCAYGHVIQTQDPADTPDRIAKYQ